MVGPALVFFLFLLMLLFLARFNGNQSGNGFPIVGVNASQERYGLEKNEVQEVVQDVVAVQDNMLC